MERHADYVIVGAGSAGCVLARRLVDAGARVLLLEAGGSDRRLEVRMPAAFTRLFRGELDWAYETEPEPQLAGRRLQIPRGRVVGGSSSVNAMLYVRGNPTDYDGWASAGCRGWDWGSVRPLFLRQEDAPELAGEHHGRGGPLRVSRLRTCNPLSRVFLDACRAAGLPPNDDFNGEVQDGFGRYDVTQRRGRRWSAADAFLRPVMGRAGLAVETGARARRLVLEGCRAVGVDYSVDGTLRRARAGREVVLAAGAIGSPQLLLLSGIGSAAELEALGLPVEVDLPGVGRNLQDHPIAPLNWHCRRPVSLASARSLPNLLRFLLLGTGPLTSPVAEVGGFLRSSRDLPAPDLQLHFAPHFYVEHGAGNPPGHGFAIAVTLLTPTSRGRVSLASADPLAAPRIESRALGDPAELSALARGVEVVRGIVAQSPFDDFRGPVFPAGLDLADPRSVADHVRAAAELVYHPVGTCRMGVDRDAVVDPDLAVYGVTGLRVVDASVMPTIPRGNTNAPTLMIAEMAAARMLGSTPVADARRPRLAVTNAEEIPA